MGSCGGFFSKCRGKQDRRRIHPAPMGAARGVASQASATATRSPVTIFAARGPSPITPVIASIPTPIAVSTPLALATGSAAQATEVKASKPPVRSASVSQRRHKNLNSFLRDTNPDTKFEDRPLPHKVVKKRWTMQPSFLTVLPLRPQIPLTNPAEAISVSSVSLEGSTLLPGAVVPRPA